MPTGVKASADTEVTVTQAYFGDNMRWMEAVKSVLDVCGEQNSAG